MPRSSLSKGCFNLFPTPHHDRDARLSNSANCGLWSAPPNHFHGKLEGTHWGPHLENICNTFGAHCQRVSHALEHKDINCTSMQHLLQHILCSSCSSCTISTAEDLCRSTIQEIYNTSIYILQCTGAKLLSAPQDQKMHCACFVQYHVIKSLFFRRFVQKTNTFLCAVKACSCLEVLCRWSWSRVWSPHSRPASLWTSVDQLV